MRPRLPAIVLMVLLAVGLAACSDDPDPIIADPPEAPTSSATSAPSTPPVTSDTTEPEPERETAKEFIRRWQAEAYLMQVSGDPSTYRSMTRGCESCDNLVRAIEDIYADGGSVVLDEPTVERAEMVGRSRGVLVFEFDVVTPRTTVLDGDGEVTQRLQGGRTRFQTNLVRSASGEWKVTRISELLS